MFTLKNPLPQAIRDNALLRNFYREYNLVPYAGSSSYSGHSFLRILCDLYELSPSHGTCIEDKRFWAFEGDLSVVPKGRSGLKSEDSQEALPVAEQEAFVDEYEAAGLDFSKLAEIVSVCSLNEQKTGNAFLRYREIQVGAARVVQVMPLDPVEVMYLNTAPGEPRSVVISKDFFAGKFHNERPPEVVRVYPGFSEGQNYRETVFHWKNKRDGSDWYGRPSTLQTLYWQYVEWKKAETEGKISGTETTAKYIFGAMKPNPLAQAVDGEDPEQEFARWAANLRKIVTAKGEIEDVEGVGFIGYPFEGQAPTLYKMDVFRDSNYLETTINFASDYIYASHRWGKAISGFSQAAANIGGNVLIDEFLFRNASAIKPLQRKWSNRMKRVFTLIADFTGGNRLRDYGIKFEDKVENLVESLKDDTINEEGSTDFIEDRPGPTDL